MEGPKDRAVLGYGVISSASFVKTAFNILDRSRWRIDSISHSNVHGRPSLIPGQYSKACNMGKLTEFSLDENLWKLPSQVLQLPPEESEDEKEIILILFDQS